MASTSQRQKGRDRALPALDAVIQVLSLAKDSCGIPPAQAVFGVASALLATIRVRSSHSGWQISEPHVALGLLGQQTGLHRFWAIVRRVQSSRPGVEGKTVG
jgi:hypothetical protein